VAGSADRKEADRARAILLSLDLLDAFSMTKGWTHLIQ
jgi:hypothetical protein